MQSIYPEIQFVGREFELENFNTLFRNSGEKKWALLLYGPGGIGKTQLLKKFLKTIREDPSIGAPVLTLSEENLIDLYWTEHRREETLLRSLALKLAPDGFQEFFAAWNEYEYESGLASDELNLASVDKLRQAFLVGYQNLEAPRIVLAFDTAEQASESVLRFFRGVLQEMHQVKPGTFVLIAGRPEGRERVLSAMFGACEDWIIGPLSKDEIRDYLKREGLSSLEDEAVEQISKMVEGLPIRVALVIDWLKEGNTLEELLESPDLNDIDKNLVRRIASVRYPEDWIILYMALFDRRFNEEFVPILLPSAAENAYEHLERMSRFSFVKYYPPLMNQTHGNWQLHDEMRDLIKRHLWPEEDFTGDTRQRAREKIIQLYYDKKIAELMKEARTDQTLLRIFKQERLYYLLPIDLETGFKSYQELSKDAEKEGDRAATYLETLNDELKYHREKLTKEQFKIWQVNQVIAGAISFERLSRDQALEMLQTVDWHNWDIVSQAEVRYRLAQIYNRQGNQQHLLDLCSLIDSDNATDEGEWVSWFKEQIKSDLSSSDRKSVVFDFAQLLVTVGIVYRSQGRLNHAVTYFKESIKLLEEVGDAQSSIANAQNNLGYVYQRMGRTDEALAECQAALDIRKRFGRLDQLGYSYNVIGTIRVEQLRPEEAETCFKQALDCFDKANVESGRGLVLIAYGRLLRQWGEYREMYGEAMEKHTALYERSYTMLREAIGIFRRLGDRSNLMDVLNEAGTLMRQMQQWDESASYYNESLNIARVLPNYYRESDNECDLGILYFRKGELEKALMYSENAAQMADKITAFYIKSKARQTSASVYMLQNKYELAFAAAADAATGILRLSPDRFVESAAKRTLEYERVLQWLREKVILKLPSQNLVEEAVSLLVKSWNNEIVEPRTGKRLVDEFPGFISALERVKRDYQFLKSRPEVSA